jgi:ribosome-binding protein aMBF1 (putative translation factor)
MIKENSRYYLNKNQAQTYIFGAKVLPEMTETLGELIQRRMKDVGISSKSELARRIGKSEAYVGDLINDTGKTKSGSYKPSPEVVNKLSKTLEISEIEILNAIGYAPQNGNTFNINIGEDVRLSLLHGEKLTEEEQQEFVQAFNVAYEIAKKRIDEKRAKKE